MRLRVMWCDLITAYVTFCDVIGDGMGWDGMGWDAMYCDVVLYLLASSVGVFA